MIDPSELTMPNGESLPFGLLEEANEALLLLKQGKIQGATVLKVE